MALTKIKENDYLREECENSQSRIVMAVCADEDEKFPIRTNVDYSETCSVSPSRTGQRLAIISHDNREWVVYAINVLFEDCDTPKVYVEVMRGQQQTDTLDCYDLMPDQLDKIATFVEAINYGFIPYNK